MSINSRGQRDVSCLKCRKVVKHVNLDRHFESLAQHDKQYARKLQYICEKKITMDVLDTLLDEAGIEFSQIGRNRGDYHLARYGDTGKYEIGNCRFITMEENLAERKTVVKPYVRTDAHRRAVGERMRKANTGKHKKRDALGRYI